MQTERSRFRFDGMLSHIGHPMASLFKDDQSDFHDVVIMQPGDLAFPKTSSDKTAVASLKDDGYRHFSGEVSIRPVLMLRGTPEFRAMDVSKRKCLYPDEKELSISDHYSEANCYLECAWRRAIETCECVPWFMSDKYPELDMCGQPGNSCFKKIVDTRYDDDDPCASQCPSDCETLEFEVSLQKKNEMNSLVDCQNCEM